MASRGYHFQSTSVQHTFKTKGCRFRCESRAAKFLVESGGCTKPFRAISVDGWREVAHHQYGPPYASEDSRIIQEIVAYLCRAGSVIPLSRSRVRPHTHPGACRSPMSAVVVVRRPSSAVVVFAASDDAVSKKTPCDVVKTLKANRSAQFRRGCP